MLVYFIGTCVWGSMVLVLWWHGYNALTFAQSSLNATRLLSVSGIGMLWSVVGAAWLAKLKKTRKT